MLEKFTDIVELMPQMMKLHTGLPTRRHAESIVIDCHGKGRANAEAYGGTHQVTYKALQLNTRVCLGGSAEAKIWANISISIQEGWMEDDA